MFFLWEETFFFRSLSSYCYHTRDSMCKYPERSLRIHPLLYSSDPSCVCIIYVTCLPASATRLLWAPLGFSQRRVRFNNSSLFLSFGCGVDTSPLGSETSAQNRHSPPTFVTCHVF